MIFEKIIPYPRTENKQNKVQNAKVASSKSILFFK